jgi:hypothetical protein
MSTFPLGLDQNQNFFGENILSNNISSDIKYFKNIDRRSMMNIDNRDNQDEEFNREFI